uniref:von Willebrand factor n=1 Tax=Sphenodon punctatus TaxID=8508 RepID=A0A8D0LCC8_SPHPU
MISFTIILLQLTLPVLTSEGKSEEPSFTRCSLFGEDHIKTFDESFYDFAGDCSYLLAGDCQKRSFSLLGDYQNGRRNSLSLYLGEYFGIHLFLDRTVTQGDKRISMPYASHGIFLEIEAGYYKLSSNVHGFVVKADISGNIQIMLADKHYNKTCGLCGNFNSFAEDDFRTQEGTLVANGYDFANSWAMHNEEKRCTRASPPSRTCNISPEIADKGVMDSCQLLRTSSVFSKCHHRVDPDQFIGLCEEDMCTCAPDVKCRCPAFLEYARSCAQEGVILEGWPTDSMCRPTCPVGMEYKECVSPCAKTCQSLNINEVCQEQCVDGCSCPEGKLLDGDHCVDSSECSCIHAGRRYPPGSSVSQDCNSCICRHGIWICSNEPCPGECSVTGQSHFKSFDNKYFTFSGICHYLFAKDCEENSFSVIIETVQCADDPDAVCTRSASVRLQDMDNGIVKLKHGGGISLNGQDIQVPLMQGGLHIQRTVMSAVRFTYKEDIQIDWDGHGKLSVKLSSVYTDRMCGLCGNYNGNQGDDFLAHSGLVETLVEDFGNSWKLKGDCQDLLKQDRDPCNLNPRSAKYAEDACSILMSTIFEPCHHEVSPSPYLKNCRYDVCSCSDGKDCLCSTVATYAATCAQKGVLIKWREPDFCAMSCPEGQLYQQCGTPCNQTCRSLSYPNADCNELCMEGCYCPPGLYVDERGDCVPKLQCSCYYDGEIFQPDDVFSDHHTMCYCENGFMHCSTNRLPGTSLPVVFFNNRPSARSKRSLTCRPPLIRFVCPENNPRAEGVECARTCQSYDLECASHGCISGCLCPEGWVRHGNKCVIPEKCPCFHNGKEYAQGELMKKDCNTCVCRDRRWDCTDNVCDGTCSVIGPAHYVTFDGLKYTFPGDCQYVLAQDYCNENSGTFRILISNEGCGFTDEKCTKRVIILFDDGRETNLEVVRSGRYYILLLGKEISVIWDLALGISVTLKENFKDQVCGLCGNFDGIQNNDLTSSNKQLEVDPNNFGNSWKVNSQCADVRKLPQGQGLTFSLCNSEVKQVIVENSCGILVSDLFKECTKLVNPEPYIDICTYDTCACESIGDCACFCDAIAAYAHICAQKGAVIQWRSSTLCPQSCEDMNTNEIEYQCEWRYNSCGPACPTTCQHFEPLECPVQCVEGCHVHCPAGKILDELSQSCVNLEECPVCELEGVKIPHGKRIVLNRDNTEHCQSCYCERKNLSCVACEVMLTTTVAPEDLDTVTREYSCSKMMDLAFLMDGSNKLSEKDFNLLKDFIISMMTKLHISQKKIRVSVLEYRTGSHVYLGLKDVKKPSQMRRTVQNIKYTGGDVASAAEVLKYIVFHVFGKAPRTNAARIALLLTASKSPGKIQSIFPLLKKKKITVIPVGLGPHISMDQIDLIERQSSENKAFIMNNLLELMERRDEIIDFLCGLVPEESPVLAATIQSPVPGVHTGNTAISTVRSPLRGSVTTSRRVDVAIVVEGSDKIGEENFGMIRDFIVRLIKQMEVGEETIHITILQYSYTITVEYSFSETQSKQDIIEKVRKMQFHGGNATNTGSALNYISRHTFTTSREGREQVPHLAYMVTANPATDTITRVPSDINIIPIGISHNVNVQELEKISQPHAPIIINDYKTLIKNVTELALNCLTTYWSFLLLLRRRPMDVLFLLDGSSNVKAPQFEEMKSFVKAFIANTHIVMQYGKENTLETSWKMPQERSHLLNMVNSIQLKEQGPSKIGEAIGFAVQHAMSESHGGRPSASKVAVILVSNTSQDSVDTAAKYAHMNRVSLLPIGVGDGYSESELMTLAGPSGSDGIIKLQRFEDLPTMVTLDQEFFNKLCTECIDDDGNKKQPGDKWTLPDQCHSVTCLPGGETRMDSYRINCERMPMPTCRNKLPAIKAEETCGCRWVCPCMCMGSSTRHIVTFDGLDFKLTGNCSYTMFQDKGNDIEVILHNGACSYAPKLNCMNSLEVKHGSTAIQLSSDMRVAVNGEVTAVPYISDHFEVNGYGAVVHEIRFTRLGHILSFTPQNNEFTFQLSPKSFLSKTFGLCGVCDQNSANDFMLSDGLVTSDSSTFVEEWTVKQPGKICEIRWDDQCTMHAPTKCSLLLSPRFAACHKIVSPNVFYATCEERGCYQEEVCEIVASYAHICQTHGICVDWRSPEFCAMTCHGSLIYDPCRTSCTKHCENSTTASVCLDYPMEGCFCPQGQVTLNDNCVDEAVCSECVGDDGARHQHMETWVPSNEPCKICMCRDNRIINCTIRPCPTAKPAVCGPCEIPRLKKNADQCCPAYECVCDLLTCDMPPVPICKDGLQPLLTNIGECRPNYSCVCKKEECKQKSIPSCPPHRKPTIRQTQCCDEYECTCNCTNSTVTCQAGYLSTTFTNDCDCTSSDCAPDKVCVHRNIVYPIGKTWKEGCTECTCTDIEDAITGLRIMECLEKTCNKVCTLGYKYVIKEGECCGKCQKNVCEEESLWSRGDVDVQRHEVGTEWRSPINPCVIHECVRVNDEVFIQKRNVSCSQMETPSCPLGFELQCSRMMGCCPSCRCGNVCELILIFQAGKRLMLDQCTSCQCSVQRQAIGKYLLECRKQSCKPCPKNYRMERINGTCCGRCLPTSCTIHLRDGRFLYLKPNETLQDGCDRHTCQISDNGDMSWERQITGCPPFNAQRCLAEGGKIGKIDTCCETYFGLITDLLIKIQKFYLFNFQGKCTSKAMYDITSNQIEDQCVCCSATKADSVQVPLRCDNGTVVQHAILNAMQCECLSHKCKQ